MCLCVYASVSLCVYVSVYVCVCVYVRVCVCVYVYMSICLCLYACLCVSMCVSMSVCVSMCVFVYLCCVDVCVCVDVTGPGRVLNRPSFSEVGVTLSSRLSLEYGILSRVTCRCPTRSPTGPSSLAPTGAVPSEVL